MRGCTFSKKIFLLVIVFAAMPMLAQPNGDWNSVLADTTIDNLKIIFNDSSEGFIVNNSGKVFALADSMDTWTLKDANVPVFALGIDFQNAENGDDTVACVVGKGGKAAITIDGGNNWDTVNTGTTNDLNAIQFGWCPTTKKSTAYAIGDNSTIRVSEDGGKTWAEQSTPYQFDHFYDLFFYNNEIGWIVGSTGIAYHTTDSGSDWGYLEVNQSNPDYYGVYFTSTTEGWVCGTNGYLGTTSDGGTNWTQKTSGTVEVLNDIAFNLLDTDTVRVNSFDTESIYRSAKTNKLSSSNYHGIVVGNNGTALRTTDGGASWISINLGTTSDLNDVTVDPDGYFWIVGDNGTIFNNRPKIIIPTSPTNLTAITVSSSQINLNWTDNSNDETGFIIEEKVESGGTWTVKDSVASNVVEYQSIGLSSNTKYYYRVTAYNIAGESSASNEIYATTLGVIPTAPTNLTAAVASSSQIDLSWTDNSNNESYFRIERKTDQSDFTELITVNSNVVAYSDNNLVDGTNYTYKICAINTTGSSGYSNEASGITPLNSPTELSAIYSGANSVLLNWKDNSQNETGFKIERKSLIMFYFQIAEVDENTTSYVDTNFSGSGELGYRVIAYNDVINSEYSDEAWVTVTDITEENILPKEFVLHQNYPNPFNPTTTIRYQIPTAGFVTLKIYDLLGRECISLVKEEKPAGYYKVTFNGYELSTGIYFYELRCGQFKQIKKMILLK